MSAVLALTARLALQPFLLLKVSYDRSNATVCLHGLKDIRYESVFLYGGGFWVWSALRGLETGFFPFVGWMEPVGLRPPSSFFVSRALLL